MIINFQNNLGHTGKHEVSLGLCKFMRCHLLAFPFTGIVLMGFGQSWQITCISIIMRFKLSHDDGLPDEIPDTAWAAKLHPRLGM